MVSIYKIDRLIILLLFILLPIMSFFHFPGMFTVVSLLFILSFLYYLQYSGLRDVAISLPLKIWFILTVYHWINAMIKHVPEVDTLDLLHGIKIYACIAIFAFLARRNFDETIKSLLICFELYLIISLFVNDMSSKVIGPRLSGAIFATALGQTAALTGIYIAYYSLRQRLSIVKSAALYILPIVIILMTQSRNSLAMLAIGIIGHTIAISTKRGVGVKKSLIYVLILLTISFFAFDFIVNNTELGTRLADTETAAQMNSNNMLETNTIFDKIAGDRLIYYVQGWQYFLESPITGIGMWNFQYVSKGDYPLHTEYMVQLCEGGVIALTLWLIFIIVVIKGVRSSRIDNYIKVIAIFSIIEILFCAMYARVFYYEFFYPIIGILISFSSPKYINRIAIVREQEKKVVSLSHI